MKKFFTELGFGLFICMVTLLLLEVLLRFIPSPIQYPPIYERDDPDSLVGIEMVPNARQPIVTSCFTSRASVNNQGWRDDDREYESDAYRVALLGDSFAEGWGVGHEEMLSQQLESALGDGVEVLNFGISSIGTVQQDILLEHEVLKYDPDAVLLLFYSNDVRNSHPVLEGGPGRATHLHYRDEHGEIVSYSKPGAFFKTRKWLRMHSTLFRLAKTVHGQVRQLLNTVVETDAPVLSSFDRLALYEPPKTPEWEEAWTAVEQSLLAMRDRLYPDTKFYVAYAPDIIQTSYDPAAFVREYGGDPSSTFDAEYPYRRLLDFAQRNDIETIDILAAFKQYRNAHNVQYPYFSFACDVHWSALGHQIAAEAVARTLRLDIEE